MASSRSSVISSPSAGSRHWRTGSPNSFSSSRSWSLRRRSDKGSAESKDSDEKIEASLRRIEERLATLPDDAPTSATEGWKLPDTPLQAAARVRIQRDERPHYGRARDGRDGLWFFSLDVSSVVKLGRRPVAGSSVLRVDHVGAGPPARALPVASHRRRSRPP
jgi:hypothetical protein